MDVLETLEALRPLQQCVQLLVRESDAAARVEAEVLVGKALAHEHMRRRRSASKKDKKITESKRTEQTRKDYAFRHWLKKSARVTSIGLPYGSASMTWQRVCI